MPWDMISLAVESAIFLMQKIVGLAYCVLPVNGTYILNGIFVSV